MRERDIFILALEKDDPIERASALEAACQGDVVLRGQVERLLAEHERREKFILDSPPADLADTIERAIVEQPGSIIGPYKLLQQIGEGGMGVVFMAEQQVPIHRTVALKIIKPGMDTRRVIARFEAERQALALMDHPNIAKVLDAGTTETGRPYFVMELVKGVSITQYADQLHLSVGERLELMTAVCRAVQHAHQKGLIHRDLKPSNVMVARHDHEAVPKVIDFGVAKATAQKLTERTMFTEFGQVIGSLEYMSPEQAQLNQLDIDTRSDIYSLGVLLYELLTGSTPLERTRLHEAAFDEMLRIIREEEPPKPSTRLSTAEGLPNIAASRGSEPKKLTGLVQGELDWIVMKALEKDRNRRYDTANDLAADIQRYLHDQPVQACPASAIYRFRKFAQRHKIGVAASLAVAVAVLVGVGGTTAGMIWALRERKAAEVNAAQARTEAARSAQVAHFLKDMLQGVAPSKALGRDTAMLREIVDNTAKRIDQELKEQPDVQIEMRLILGKVYFDLQLYREMERNARRTVELARERSASENVATADALGQLGQALMFLRNNDEAESVARQAIAMQRRLRGPDSLQEAVSLLNLCDILRNVGSDSSGDERARKLAEAEEMGRAAVAIRRKLLGDANDDTAWALVTLSITLNVEGKLAEAEGAIRQAYGIRMRLHGEEHPYTASDMMYLALVLNSQGKYSEAEECCSKSVTIMEKLDGKGKLAQENLHHFWGNALRGQGKLSEAEAHYRESIQIGTREVGVDNVDVADGLTDLAGLLKDEGKLIDARQCAEQAVDRYRRFPSRTMQLSAALALLAGIEVRNEEFAAAESEARECLEIREKRIPDDWRTFNTRSVLGAALLGQRKYAESESLLLSGYEGLKQREATIPRTGKSRLKEAAEYLVRLYEASDQPDKAAQWKETVANLEKLEAGK